MKKRSKTLPLEGEGHGVANLILLVDEARPSEPVHVQLAERALSRRPRVFLTARAPTRQVFDSILKILLLWEVACSRDASLDWLFNCLLVKFGEIRENGSWSLFMDAKIFTKRRGHGVAD